jgi:hypothetical protein
MIERVEHTQGALDHSAKILDSLIPLLEGQERRAAEVVRKKVVAAREHTNATRELLKQRQGGRRSK